MAAKKKTKKKAAAGKKKTTKKGASRGLNANQRLFVELYLATQPRNGTQAYKSAYGVTDDKVAWAAASRLLSTVKVKEHLEKREAEIFNERFAITQDRIAEEMAVLAYSRPTDFGHWDGKQFVVKSFEDIPDALMGAVKSIRSDKTKDGESRVYLTFYNKEKALELLGRYKKMFKEELTLEAGDTLSQLLNELSGRTLGPPSERGEK